MQEAGLGGGRCVCICVCGLGVCVCVWGGVQEPARAGIMN